MCIMLFINNSLHSLYPWLQVNGVSLDSYCHDEAVSLLKEAGDDVTLCVKYFHPASLFLNKSSKLFECFRTLLLILLVYTNLTSFCLCLVKKLVIFIINPLGNK